MMAQNTPSPATPGSNTPGAKHFSPGATTKKSVTLFILLVYA
jgi:hypothetical protein